MSRIKAIFIASLLICFATFSSIGQIDGIAIKDSTQISAFEHFFLPMKVVSGDTLNFDADTLNYDFNWTIDGRPISPQYKNFPSNNNDTIPFFRHQFEAAGAYNVTLEIINDTSGISYFTALDISINNDINVPNVFTPDGDGKNDLFVVKSPGNPNEKLKLLIYTRNGNLVHEKIAPVVYWDGKLASGNDAQQGVYYYIVVPQGNTDRAQKGFFYLYR